MFKAIEEFFKDGELAVPEIPGAIGATLVKAVKLAKERGDDRVCVEHMLLALCDDSQMMQFWNECVDGRCDPRLEVEARLNLLFDGCPKVDNPLLTEELLACVEDTVGGGKQSQLDLQAMPAPMLMVAAVRAEHPFTTSLLKKCGLTTMDLLWYVSHKEQYVPPVDEMPTDGADDDLVTVVIYNDPFTTMEFVVEVLKDLFGMSHEEAVERMLHVHSRGHTVCAGLERSQARPLVHKIRRMAQEKGFPLKVEATS